MWTIYLEGQLQWPFTCRREKENKRKRSAGDLGSSDCVHTLLSREFFWRHGPGQTKEGAGALVSWVVHLCRFLSIQSEWKMSLRGSSPSSEENWEPENLILTKIDLSTKLASCVLSSLWMGSFLSSSFMPFVNADPKHVTRRLQSGAQPFLLYENSAFPRSSLTLFLVVICICASCTDQYSEFLRERWQPTGAAMGLFRLSPGKGKLGLIPGSLYSSFWEEKSVYTWWCRLFTFSLELSSFQSRL